MIFQFSDGEFSGPIATSLKMWKKINSFIVIITFSVTLEQLSGLVLSVSLAFIVVFKNNLTRLMFFFLGRSTSA